MKRIMMHDPNPTPPGNWDSVYDRRRRVANSGHVMSWTLVEPAARDSDALFCGATRCGYAHNIPSSNLDEIRNGCPSRTTCYHDSEGYHEVCVSRRRISCSVRPCSDYFVTGSALAVIHNSPWALRSNLNPDGYIEYRCAAKVWMMFSAYMSSGLASRARWLFDACI